MKTATLRIEGMHCAGCATRIEALLARTGGVQKATVSFRQAEAHVLYDPNAVTEDQLNAVIERAGYRVTGSARLERERA